MRKILVTAIGGDVGNGILKILSKGSDEIYGCDINDYPIGMDKVKSYWKSDLAVSHQYIDNLLIKCKQFEISHLIPVNEMEIIKVSEHKEVFKQHNIQIIIQDSNVLNICLDKLKTMKFLEKHMTANVPYTYTYDNFVENGEKHIVKLRNSCGSKYLQYITEKRELDQIPYYKDEYIIQQYLKDDNEEYTIGVFSNGYDVRTIIFKRKLEHGHTSFVELTYNAELQQMAIEVANFIGLKGYINIQSRKFNDSYKIFEINPRISGTVYFRYLLGFDDVTWWLNLVDNKKIPEYMPIYKKAIGIRELSEKFVIME